MTQVSLGTLRDLFANKAATATLQNAAVANGNGTDFVVDGYGVANLQITGTFEATVTFRGSVDGTNFVPIFGRNRNTGQSASTTTAAGIYGVDCRGLQKIRAVISGYVSGDITVSGRAEPFAGSPESVGYDSGTDRLKTQVENVVDIRQVGKYIAKDSIGTRTIGAGQALRIPLADIDCHEIAVLVHVAIGEQNHNVTVKYQPTHLNQRLESYGTNLLVNTVTQNNAAITSRFAINSPSFEINLTNHDNIPHTYNLFLLQFYKSRG